MVSPQGPPCFPSRLGTTRDGLAGGAPGHGEMTRSFCRLDMGRKSVGFRDQAVTLACLRQHSDGTRRKAQHKWFGGVGPSCLQSDVLIGIECGDALEQRMMGRKGEPQRAGDGAAYERRVLLKIACDQERIAGSLVGETEPKSTSSAHQRIV